MTNLPSLLQCPDCSRVLNFTHADTTVIRCDCGSIISRRDGVLKSNPFYSIQSQHGIIQPGTTGKWQENSFTVIGRFRAWYPEFVFNYWTIVFGDGRMALLGEGYGIYAVYESEPPGSFVDSGKTNHLNAGDWKKVGNKQRFLFERIYACYRWEVEGEAWLPEIGSSFRMYELADMGGFHWELITAKNGELHAFKIYYTSFHQLLLENLRTDADTGHTIPCSGCGKDLHIKTWPYSQSCACPKCGSRYSVKEEQGFRKINSTNSIDFTPVFPLGSRGVLKGIGYEVVGYAVKEEQNEYQSQWREYTLYNREEGFAFLSEYDGHWTFLHEANDAPVIEGRPSSFTYGEENFQLYNSYTFATVHTAGEFSSNIFNDDSEKSVLEYISPPEIWIREFNTIEGIVWYHGEHLEPGELKQAFGNANELPSKSGVGAVEPRGYMSIEKMLFAGFTALVLMLVLHFLVGMTKQERIILDQIFPFAGTEVTLSHVTPPFELDKRSSNLEIIIEAPVDNSWFELGAVLVNTVTGAEYTVSQGVEYYHGYSEGEGWSEGSRSETAWFSSIPEGKYILQLQGTREAPSISSADPTYFLVRVIYDAPNHRNLLVCGVALVLVLVGMFLRIRYAEHKRWSNSPYSPYTDE
jgi:DNA-directed RNA polymerase subunit RPC12/RpoP